MKELGYVDGYDDVEEFKKIFDFESNTQIIYSTFILKKPYATKEALKLLNLLSEIDK